ncbi:MAG: putative addiction module antidote protein [Limnothrix sp. RL_2_0]|nr:putative addiction module antidote protein [Limnothrix sp. RL_2_0]
MTTTTTHPWDVTEHLNTKEAIAAYLEAALETGDPSFVAVALSDIGRSQGLAKFCHETGLEYENLNIALSPNGNLDFVTVVKALQSLGLRLQVIASV